MFLLDLFVANSIWIMICLAYFPFSSRQSYLFKLFYTLISDSIV